MNWKNGELEIWKRQKRRQKTRRGEKRRGDVRRGGEEKGREEKRREERTVREDREAMTSDDMNSKKRMTAQTKKQ